MNGPEHYAAAERCLDYVNEAEGHEARIEAFAEAQVHASLALAAVTWDAALAEGVTLTAWAQVLA